MRWLNRILGGLMAGILLVWRWTIRVQSQNDPRESILASGKGVSIAFLHAHQLPGLMGVRRSGSMVMVSRSRDGDLMIPTLKLLGIQYARGSSGQKGRDKGGASAFTELSAHVANGGSSLIAVDGPLGPRGKVHRGAARLAVDHDTALVPLVIVTNWRWIAKRNWDRLQVPFPFSRVTLHFGDPIWPEGRTVEEISSVAARVLAELEAKHDPDEAEACKTQVRPRTD